MTRKILPHVICLLSICFSPAVTAQVPTWTGAGKTGNWKNSANWMYLPEGVEYPDNGMDAHILSNYAPTIREDMNITLGNLLVGDETGNSKIYIDGALNVNDNFTIGLESSTGTSSCVLSRYMGPVKLNVGKNLTLVGDNSYIMLLNNTFADIEGNAVATGDSKIWLSQFSKMTVGGELGVPKINLGPDCDLFVNRLTDGMNLEVNYSFETITWNAFRIAGLEIETPSSIDHLSVSFSKGFSGLFTTPSIDLFDGKVAYNSHSFTNNTKFHFDLNDTGELVFDDLGYEEAGLVWNFDEERVFVTDRYSTDFALKMMGTSNPEIIITLNEWSFDLFTIDFLAGYLKTICNNPLLEVTVFSENQLLMSGEFMSSGYAYFGYEQPYIESPLLWVTQMEARFIPTPEPATWGMLLLGGAGVVWMRNRKRFARQVRNGG